MLMPIEFWIGEYQLSQRLWARRARLAFNSGLYERAAKNQLKAAHFAAKARHMMGIETYAGFDGDNEGRKHGKKSKRKATDAN